MKTSSLEGSSPSGRWQTEDGSKVLPEAEGIPLLWSWSPSGMWEMWVHAVVAGGTHFPGACLSFPTACLKSVEGGALNNVGYLSNRALLGNCCRNAKRGILLCEEQTKNWLEAESEAAPLALSPSNLHPLPASPAASLCACPELKQFWQESQVLQPQRLLWEEGSVRLEGC